MSNPKDKDHDLENQSGHTSQHTGENHDRKDRTSSFKQILPKLSGIGSALKAPWQSFSHLGSSDFKRLYFPGRKGWLKFREYLVRLRFVWKWMIAAMFLAIPIVVFAKRFPHVSIKGVPVLGLSIWLELSWAAVLIAYSISWALGQFFDRLCQQDLLNISDYDCLVRDLKYPIVFVFWSIMSWALVPYMCIYEHQHCTSHWLTIFEKVLLATIVVSVVWFTKALLLELLFIETAIKFMSKKQTILINGLSSILLLATPTKVETAKETAKETTKETTKEANEGERAGIETAKETTQETIRDANKRERANAETTKGQVTKESTKESSKGEITKAETTIVEIQGDATKKAWQEKAAKWLLTSSIYRRVVLLSLMVGFLICCLFQWLGPVFLKPKPDTDPKEPEKPLACTTRILHGEGNKSHYKTLRDNIRKNFKKNLVKAEVKKHLKELEELRQQGKLEAEVAQATCTMDENIIWRNLDLFEIESGIAPSTLDPILTVIGRGLREVSDSRRHLWHAISDLNIIVSFLFLIAATLIYVSFFVKNPSNYMTLFWTSFAGLSFALSGPAQEFVSSCVFVFSQHPYDVDDWVNIMSGKDDTLLKLRVTDIRLMSSTFRRDKLAKLVSIPHNKLSKERIENLSRWDTMYDIMEPIPLEGETVITDDMFCDEETSKKTGAKLQGTNIRKDGSRYIVDMDESTMDHIYARYITSTAKPMNIQELSIVLAKGKNIPTFEGMPIRDLRKEAVEEVVNNHIKEFVMEPTSFPVGRFYRMPSISIEPTKDPDTNYQVEITFSCKKFISGYDDNHAKLSRDAVKSSIQSFLANKLKVKVKPKSDQTKKGNDAGKGKQTKQGNPAK